MSALFARAYAKVNLSLDVCGKKEDGYHELSGVMQQISLCDDLWAEQAESISIRCNLPFIPTDERNILWKAAKAFFKYTNIKGKGVCFTLHKRIPSGAGLGGGSSDGTAAIKLLNQIYQTHLSDEQMVELVAPVGADLPFFVYGGTALAEGIGDKLKPLTPIKQGAMLLIKPSFSLPTPKIFAAMDEMHSYPHPDVANMVQAVEKGDITAVAEAMGNSMQYVVERSHPEISVLCEQIKAAGAMNAIMSGSGSTVFGLFKDVQSAKNAALLLIKNNRSCYIVTPKE